jgi:SAM-dependent methyltransferase
MSHQPNVMKPKPKASEFHERGYVSRGEERLHERLYPDQWERYRFALNWIRQGAEVADIACGSGFGTNLLSRGIGLRALGLDVSAEALSWAKANYGESSDFDYATPEILHAHADRFDFVVSFETLEHMSRDDGVFFLERIAYILKPSGTLILSTPCTSGKGRLAPANPFHVREYDWEELAAMVDPLFVIERRFTQLSRLARLREAIGRANRAEPLARTDSPATSESVRGGGIASLLAGWLRQHPFWRRGSFVPRQSVTGGVQLVVARRRS